MLETRHSSEVARVCDAGLVLCILGLGAWTPAYHACLLLGLGTGWPLAVLAIALAPCTVLAVRSAGARPAPRAPGGAPGAARSRSLAAGLLALLAAAALAFRGLPWPLVWASWVLAAAAVAVAVAAAQAPGVRMSAMPAGTVTALAWAA